MSSPADERLGPSSVADTTATAVGSDIQGNIETIKNVAGNIRHASAKLRDTVRTLRQSGAINELIYAIHDAVIAARDTTIEISEIARDLRERGVIKDTAIALEQAAKAARETAETVKYTAQQVGESAPQTAEIVKEAANRIKSMRSGYNNMTPPP